MGKHKDKDKDSEKKSKKEKKEKKEKKAKKERSKEKRKRRDSSSSSSSSSDDDVVLSPREQLRRERAAVAALRELLWYHQAAKKDLRELLWTVDQGKAANIGGIPDVELRQRLRTTLELLGLKKAGSKDVLALPKGTAPTLSIVGFVFDEQPRPPPAKPAPAPAPAPAAQHGKGGASSDGQKDQGTGAGSSGRGQQSESSPSPSPGGEPGQGAREVGVAGPPPHSRGVSGDADSGPDQTASGSRGQGEGREGEEEEDDDEAARRAARRRAGPAMPTAEQLAAAAEAAAFAPPPEEGEEEEGGPRFGMDEEGGLDDLMVGPPPPDMVEEMDSLPEDARDAEVVRIMRVLRDARNAAESAAAALGPLAPKPADPANQAVQADAYDVLGVAHDAAAPDIKKRYMRLSLLIHPDKCTHKDAHEAFQAVATAAKTLQDSGARGALDAAREDVELRKAAIAAAQAEERARQWRVARGEEPAGPAVPGSLGALPIARESWMTELPPERQAALAGLSQVSKRAFSQKGIKPRGDTSEWTDTPADRAAKAKLGPGALQQGTAGPMLLTAGTSGRGASAPSGLDARMMDSFNNQARKKTLLEQHMEQQEEEKAPKTKKAKVAAGPAGPGPSGPAAGAADGADDKSWVGKHPWRPFDREKDLQLKPKALDPSKLLQQQGALSGKFSSAGGTRHFL